MQATALELVREPQQSRAMGKAARQHCLDHSWTHVVSRFERVLAEAAKTGYAASK